ncbi:TPA: phage tail protein [Listeria monocytogenes]|nr:phage tail protein [Listeria monocytogenes]
MIPILYESKNTDFENNGLGILKDIITATVDETLNGPCELTIEYPVTARLFDKISDESIFKVKSNEVQNFQLFRAYNIVRDEFTSSIIVKAKHITNDATSNFVEDFTVENITPGAALNKLFSSTAYPSKFSGTSDIATLSSTSIQRKNPLEIIAGVEGSLLDTWGGELVRDNFSIKLLKRRGRDKVASIRYRKNLTGLETDVDTENVITRIYPFANKQDSNGNEQTIVLPEKYIDSEHINAYSNVKILAVDYSSDDTVTDVTTLRNVAGKYFMNNKTDIPEMNIKVSFEPLSEMTGYEKYKNLEAVELGDTVTVYHPDLNVNITAKAVRTKYNVITEKYEEIELGSVKADFTDTLKSDISKIIDEVPTQDWMQNELKAIGDSIQGANGGNIYTFPTFKPSTMYFMDTDNVNTAKKVMVMNREGIAFYQNGITGIPKTAWGIDGKFVADWIGTGTLRAIDIEGVSITGSSGFFDTLYSSFLPGLPAPQYKEELKMGGGVGFHLTAKSVTKPYPAMQMRMNTNGDLGLAIEAVNENTGAIDADRVVRLSPFAGIETPLIQSDGWCCIGANSDGKTASIDRHTWISGGGPQLRYVPHRASNFETASSEEYKKNIRKVKKTAFGKTAKQVINETDVFTYSHIADETNEKKIGFIAEQASDSLTTADGKAIDLYNSVAWLYQYAKENEEEKEALKAEVKELKNLVNKLVNEVSK